MTQEIKVTFKDGREPTIVPELNLHNIRRIHGADILSIEYVDGENPEMKFIGLEAIKKEVVEPVGTTNTITKESLTELEDQNFEEEEKLSKSSKKKIATENQSKKTTGSKKSKTKQEA